MKAKSRKRTGQSARKSKAPGGNSSISAAPADRDPLPPKPPQGKPVMLVLSVVLFVGWFLYLVFVALVR